MPCRGGTKQAPATSSHSSPESEENFEYLCTSDYVEDEIQTSIASASASHIYDTQQLPLPHIDEEEELEPNQEKIEETTLADDRTSLREHLITSQRSSNRISEHSQSSQSRHNSGSVDENLLSNSPSPRAKQSRKHTKGRNKSITSTTSSDTVISGGPLCNLSSVSVLTNSLSGYLAPSIKMQAEQGSIGDLQKYHSRYLKNRRHTLANVR